MSDYLTLETSAALSPDVMEAAGSLVDAAWPGYLSLFKGEIAAYQSSPHIFQPHFITAFVEEKVVGFAVLLASLMSDSLNVVSWLTVDDSHRNKKIGSRLISSCIAQAQYRRKDIILTTIVPDFYRNHGFRVIERFKNNENVLMVHDLQSISGRK